MPTVAELLTKLLQLVEQTPQAANAQIILAGCDCDGPWDGGELLFYPERIITGVDPRTEPPKVYLDRRD